MPLVSIKMIAGRTLEQKREMARDITDAIVKNVGCPPTAVTIDIIEYSPENIGQGGELFCDTRR